MIGIFGIARESSGRRRAPSTDDQLGVVGSPLLFIMLPRWMPSALRIGPLGDRKSTRLNSSHQIISYAVFCLKKKKKQNGGHDLNTVIVSDQEDINDV